MKVLFFSHYFPPEVNAPALRTFEHCREWVRAGHEVTVVSCVPNHPMGRVFPGYKNRLWQREEREGIKVVRLLTYATANEGFLKRTFNYFFYMVMAIIAAPFLSRCDVVVTTSPQFFNGLAGYFISRIKRAPWVLEIRDLWPESILAVGAITNPRMIRLLEGLESFAYRKADGIVSVSDSFVAHVEKRGGHDKVSVIKNGVDLSLFHTAPRDEALAAELGLEGKFIASYVGTHGMAHGLKVVLDAADKLKDDPSIVFLMVGDGAEKEMLRAQNQSRKLDNVVMLDQQPREMMPRIWSITDASLVLLRRQELFTKVIPSKIFESMAMGKPVVLGVEGESRSIIEAAGAGIGIEPENAAELASTIRSLADNKLLCQRLGTSGQAYVRANFDRRRLACEYLALLEKIISSRRTSRRAIGRANRPI